MDLLTVAETAALLRVHPETVRRHIKSGRLLAVRVGRHVRVERHALESFARPTTPAGRGNGTAHDAYGRTLTPEQLIARALIRPLTDDEREKALLAIEELRAFREKVAARHGVKTFPESWPLIREAREERDRQLWGPEGGEAGL